MPALCLKKRSDKGLAPRMLENFRNIDPNPENLDLSGAIWGGGLPTVPSKYVNTPLRMWLGEHTRPRTDKNTANNGGSGGLPSDRILENSINIDPNRTNFGPYWRGSP